MTATPKKRVLVRTTELLAFAVVPRLAAVRVLPGSRVSGRIARESLVVTLGTALVCAFLALLLVRAAL